MSLLPVGFGASGEDYTIDDSLRLRSSASAYLSWTPGSNGNRQIRSEERRVGKEGRSRWWPYH